MRKLLNVLWKDIWRKLPLFILRKSTPLASELHQFQDNQIKVLMELKQNILLVCDDCMNRKPCAIPKIDNSQKELSKNIEKLNKQLNDYAESVAKTFRVIDEMKSETKSIKNSSVPNFRSADGDVPLGRQVCSPSGNEMGIRLKWPSGG